MNTDTKFALDFHEETKHSEIKVQMSRHYLDWDNRPRPFKVYPDLSSLALPDDFDSPGASALDYIGTLDGLGSESPIDLRALAQLLFFSAGITRKLSSGPETFYMRAASATGALYPIELYVISGKISGLAAGVYHFCPGDFSLVQLRAGDFRAKLASMAGGRADIRSSPLTIAFTSIAWRNAWKYRARSYRHWFWDSGVIAANLLAAGAAVGLCPKLILGFADREVNDLLLLEPEKEAAIILAPIGSNNELSGNTVPVDVPTVHRPRVMALSKTEVQYPEIWTLHEASSLDSSEASSWSAKRIDTGKLREATAHHTTESFTLGETILRRGSSRSFSHAAIPKEKLLNILYYSTRGVPLDILEKGQTLIDIYLIANAVDGLEPGSYFYDRNSNTLQMLAAKNQAACRSESAYLCLGQRLFGDSSALLFMMSDLEKVLKVFGNRGYRACQLEGGVVAGKVYLSSYAQELGASGSTFYDDAVTEAFSSHAGAKSVMIAVGVGITEYKAKPGKILASRLTREQLVSQ